MTLEPEALLLPSLVALRDFNKLSYVLKRITFFDHPNENGRTALHVAASLGDFRAVELLLELGASFTLRDCGGNLAIDLARVNGRWDVCSALEQADMKRLGVIHDGKPKV